jgi:predicted DNA-binding protein with PD1-like motif
MIKTKRVGCVLVLIGIAAMTVHSLNTADGSEAVPTGKAPKMQVQLLNPGESKKQYAVIFYQGDEAFSGLIEFAEKYQVAGAHLSAIGAVSGATLGCFDPQRIMYKKLPVEGQHQVVGMIGDIALYRGKPVAHTHMVVEGRTEQRAPGTFLPRMCLRSWK